MGPSSHPIFLLCFPIGFTEVARFASLFDPSANALTDAAGSPSKLFPHTLSQPSNSLPSHSLVLFLDLLRSVAAGHARSESKIFERFIQHTTAGLLGDIHYLGFGAATIWRAGISALYNYAVPKTMRDILRISLLAVVGLLSSVRRNLG
jgi:hypothetical protein